MRLSWLVTILVPAFIAAGYSRAAPAQTHASRPASKRTHQQPQPQYLTVPLDVTLSNVGAAFLGQDITAVAEAIKKSPALAEKSEFESTSAFETRRAGFLDHPLYGTVRPTGYFGFVVEDDSAFAPAFKYDADSQVLAVTLAGNSEHFIMEKDQATLDTLPIRLVVLSRDNYIGSNAFGAKVSVARTYAEQYGLALSQKNWLLHSPSDETSRTFTYLLSMRPEEARATKTDAKILLVCLLSRPWLRHAVHSHDPTIDEPTETVIEENYLQISPEQVWVFNQKTGEVIRKLTESSVATDKDAQLALRLRQTPLILDVSPGRHIVQLSVAIDDGPERLEYLSGGSKTFTAKRQIVLTQSGLMSPEDLSGMTFTLNGKPYAPNWTKDAFAEGTRDELIRSATTVITVP